MGHLLEEIDMFRALPRARQEMMVGQILGRNEDALRVYQVGTWLGCVYLS